jgi:Domain of unknown function (DUF4167)
MIEGTGTMVPNITITTRRSLIIADGRRSGFAEAGLFRVSVFRWRYRGDLRRRWAVWCNDLSARRGSAYQIFERYLALAREAAASGDRIAAENFYQHAEHYFRINNARREGNQQETPPRPNTPADVEMNSSEPDSRGGDQDRFQP